MAALLFFCGLVMLVPAAASTIQVDPIRITIAPGTTATTLMVRNPGDTAVVLQAELLAWTQDDSGEHYEPSTALLVAPPVMTVPAAGEQVVRLGLRVPPDPTRETAYRLFLTEVPPPPLPGFRGLQVAVRLGIPVFVLPAAGTLEPRVLWSATRSGAGEVQLVAANEGTAQIRYLSIDVLAPGSALPIATQGPAYVLANQRRAFKLAVPAGTALERIRVKAVTESGVQETEIAVAPR